MLRFRYGIILLALCCAPGCDGPDASADAGPTVPADAAVLPMPCASASCDFDPFALLTDPHLPARMLPGRARLASSRQPEPPEGSGNDDFNNFVRSEDGEHVLLEADGPGVLTRLWFTGRQPAGQVYEVLDETILHMEIDGAEVVWVEGQSGVSLATLTSGTLPGFIRPWVAGRDTASNGFLVSVPIAFSESIRVWIDDPPGVDTLFYYQIDWRSLHESYAVQSFEGILSAEQVAAMEAATLLWIDRESDVPGSSTIDERTIAPGETVVLALDEPTTVRAVPIELSEGALSALEGELFVDGESAVTGPLARWTFAASPTPPHDSALTTVGEESVVFRYPFPVHGSAELRLRNTSSAPITARFGFEHDPGVPDPDLGALRGRCGEERTPPVGENLTLVDIEGERGHYAGQFLIVESSVEGFWSGFWVLEGDHEIRADEEWLLGTGLEDYFGGAFYYLRGPFVLPLTGASYLSELDGPGVPVVSQYRHHLLDTVPFDRSLRFDYESFVADSRFEYCVFWYQAR